MFFVLFVVRLKRLLFVAEFNISEAGLAAKEHKGRKNQESGVICKLGLTCGVGPQRTQRAQKNIIKRMNYALVLCSLWLK